MKLWMECPIICPVQYTSHSSPVAIDPLKCVCAFEELNCKFCLIFTKFKYCKRPAVTRLDSTGLKNLSRRWCGPNMRQVIVTREAGGINKSFSFV